MIGKPGVLHEDLAAVAVDAVVARHGEAFRRLPDDAFGDRLDEAWQAVLIAAGHHQRFAAVPVALLQFVLEELQLQRAVGQALAAAQLGVGQQLGRHLALEALVVQLVVDGIDQRTVDALVQALLAVDELFRVLRGRLWK